ATLGCKRSRRRRLRWFSRNSERAIDAQRATSSIDPYGNRSRLAPPIDDFYERHTAHSSQSVLVPEIRRRPTARVRVLVAYCRTVDLLALQIDIIGVVAVSDVLGAGQRLELSGDPPHHLFDVADLLDLDLSAVRYCLCDVLNGGELRAQHLVLG